MIDFKNVGERIRELRKKRGLSQSELAEVLSVSFQAVSNWERGSSPPDIENLVKISSYFGVLVDTLLSPMGESLYLGIDGGGTKTEFAVVSASGCVYKREKREGSNPNDIGYRASEEIISSGIRDILVEYPTVKGIFCGIAGITAGGHKLKLYNALKKLYPRINIEINSDAFNLFYLHDEADMAVISGTGSVVFAKSGEDYKRIGGWGYLFDSAGSAYDIGRDAIRYALDEEDRLSVRSSLSARILKKMNTGTVWEHINTVYDKGKAYVAEFASEVFCAYRKGDKVACEIVDKSAAALAELLERGARLYGARKIAVASGGLFEHYADIMCPHIAKYTDTRLIVSELSPIYGACRRACAMSGADISDSFYDNFKKTYGELNK